MDSTPVNWETLDSLVVDFAKSENLIEDTLSSSSSSPLSSPCPSPPPSSVSSSSDHSRLIIRQIRRCLDAGDIDSVIVLLQAHAPFILDDRRLLFQLQKQKFIELLRRGTEEGRAAAIECIRTALAPCALDAYPEAYEEFKHVLLAFIYDKDDQSSPVAYEWSEWRRIDIAGIISSVLRAHLRVYDPVFLMTLRYLICIHENFCSHQEISSPISHLTVQLLLEQRDPPAVPQESLYGAPPFDEVDIQALAHAVGLPRQGAVDSLRFAKGDLFQAFQNELCRMKLNVTLLDELVREYCVYRGIVDSGLSSPVVSGAQTLSFSLKLNQAETGCCSSRDCSLELDHATSKNSDGETCMSNTHMDVSSESNADVSSTQGTDIELRFASESTRNWEHCSTSESHQPGFLKVQLRGRNYARGEWNKRKQWKGRQDDQDCVPAVFFNRCRKQGINGTVTGTNLSREQQTTEDHSMLDLSNRVDGFKIVLWMKELTSRGMAAEVVEEVNALDSSFFVQNPLLLFQLKQVEFLKLVNSGDHASALKVACSHLGPLASSYPGLLKPLKETLLSLLRPNEDALGNGVHLHALATSLQVAIGRRLGIEEPELMRIMRATLRAHGEWFKLQMCKDRFESLLRIDSLKEANTPLLSSCTTSKSNVDSCTQGSSQITVSSNARVLEDGNSPNQVSSGEVICDENAIVKVMEFLALPRADAIHLLAQYNGNAETVIQQIFA